MSLFEVLTEQLNRLIYIPSEGMVHPGLSAEWVMVILCLMLVVSIRTVWFAPDQGCIAWDQFVTASCGGEVL